MKSEAEQKRILLIKGQNIPGVPLDYHSIKAKTVRELLKGIDPTKEWDTYGLMIGNSLLKNYQTIESVKELDCLFHPLLGSCQHLVGYVVKESQIFQMEQSKIIELGQFSLENVLYLEPERTLSKEELGQMIDHLFLLWINISQVKVIGSTNKVPSPLNRTLNHFLRNQNFAQTQPQDYKLHWEYLCISTLLKQLNKVPSVTNQVLWRGVSQAPNHGAGERLVIKPFFSTSLKKSTASVLRPFTGQYHRTLAN